MRPGSKLTPGPIYTRQKQLLKLAIFAFVSSSLALSASFVGVNSLKAEGLEGHGQDGHASEPRTQPAAGTLRNIEFLPKVCTSRPPARPRKFLRRRNLQVQVERDEKYLQLLLVSVGFVGMLILILVLRSMPPAKKSV
ncbi:hypothetical protein KBI23_06155 [bacterium]|nr:hypothetical protein [bacterium]MBP9809519.1 hypothetical protein [bacterium]